jgi:acetolactate synthase I/II/III large subunit
MTTAAEIIANGLAGAGCRHVFGMPGGEVLVLLDALDRAGVNFTLCKHENAAGFMAEGSWHMTGAPGILLTTVGPGLANGVNSIANAFQEQVPLIVLSGCIGHAEAAQFTHQVIDQSALLKPITKAQFRVAPGTAAHVIAKALAVAVSDPPGPVHIDLPDTLAADDMPEVTISAPVKARGAWPDGESRQAAIARLRVAKRPLILAGMGAMLHDAGAAITEMATRHGIPVLTTYKAKGVMDESHPLALGGHGLSPLSDKTILPLLRDSDCIVLAGYDPIEMRSGWIQPWDAQNAIEIMHAENNHGMHASAIRFVGDVALAIAALSEGIAAAGYWADGRPADARAALDQAFATPDEWGPHQVFGVLDRHAPEAAITTVDAGAHRILLTQMYHCTAPRRLLQSSAFCTMGISIPLAMGVKTAAPDLPVMAVVGDAGLDMVAGELATLRDMNVALPIIVLVDHSLGLIAKKQSAMQLPPVGVGFGATDFVTLARAYGGNGVTVRDADSLRTAINAAFDAEKFTIIACAIKKGSYQGAF